MSAHTPGPWVVFKLRLSGMFVIGKPIDERTDTQGDGLAMADTEADARIIAAAPDLLAVVRGFVLNERQLNDKHFAGVQERLMVLARAAIAKASGDESDCPGHIASDADPKVCGRCGTHIDSLRPEGGAA